MKKLWIGLLILLTVGGAVVRAETRMWTDKNGNTIEAEFVKIFSGKVVLKLPNGKQVKVPQSGLSQKDQDYLKSAIPPKIDIEVNIDRDKKTPVSWDGYVRKSEKIQGKVTITKKNREPCNKSFTAYLYIFSKDLQDDEIEVLDKAKHEFTFKNQKKIEFSGGTSKIEYTDSYYGNDYGDEYEGYLVFIEDASGKIIYTKGSRKLYENKVSQIKKAKKGSTLDNLSRN